MSLEPALSARPESLTTAERESVAWIGHVERHVILPLKWVVLVFCAGSWLWARGWQPPSEIAFLTLVVFALLNGAEHYFFAMDRVLPSQVRPLVLISFMLDSLFVTGLVLLDFFEPPFLAAPGVIGDFYLLYIAIVLRGLALNRTRGENVLAFAMVSAMFLGAASFQVNAFGVEHYLPASRKLAMIWASMLLVQAFVGLVNRQREEMLRARERSVQRAALASIGELTAGVAHEINNPIGIIKTYTDYLLQSVPVDDPQRDDIETIGREAERCEQIVRRMLDFSNPRIEGFGPVDLAQLCRETVEFAFSDGREADPYFESFVHCLDDVPPVHGDPVQLRQALLNVLLNARQVILDMSPEAKPEKGRVLIEITRASGPRAPVRLRIIDNGPGISEEDARKVFEPFFTRRKKGTGLGLAITRRIIDLHNGTIEIAPHGSGSVVTIDLPIQGEESA